jgi:nucleotide-binding universal stress UspA family protein
MYRSSRAAAEAASGPPPIASAASYRRIVEDVGMAIVVGVDGSPESKEALRWALEDARRRETPVRAVCAWDVPIGASSLASPMGMPGYEPLGPETGDAIRKGTAERLAAIVAEVVEEAGAGDVHVEQEIVQGHTAEALIRASEVEELLVVGSRGHGGIGGMLLGSVSQALAHHSRCPLVIVRPR